MTAKIDDRLAFAMKSNVCRRENCWLIGDGLDGLLLP